MGKAFLGLVCSPQMDLSRLSGAWLANRASRGRWERRGALGVAVCAPSAVRERLWTVSVPTVVDAPRCGEPCPSVQMGKP